MRITSRSCASRFFIWLLLAASVGSALILSLPVYSSPPEQGSAAPITITERGCDFDIDDDGDGKSDGSFDPADGEYLPQGDSVLGKCFFRVTATAATKISIESQLEHWEANGVYNKVAREISQPISLNAGGPSFTLDPGGHEITLVLKGDIPRGHAREELGEGYYHDLQIPKEFKLVDITVTTDAGDKEWVESHDVSSASISYIDAHSDINDALNEQETPIPPSVLAFSQQLLEEGYPEIAVRVTELNFPQDAAEADRGIDISWWVWLVIVGGIVLVGIVGFIIWWARRPPRMADD